MRCAEVERLRHRLHRQHDELIETLMGFLRAVEGGEEAASLTPFLEALNFQAEEMAGTVDRIKALTAADGEEGW